MYIAFGFLYFQQGTQQREFEAQTAKVSAIVAKPFTGGEELQAEYEEVKRALTPMTDADAIAMMVAIAEANGIDASESGGKFRVPPVGRSKATAGGGNYQILSFTGISAQGDPGDIMAFISDLDSGETLHTMVLTRLSISETTVVYSGDEAVRRAEFRQVASAVAAMMNGDNLSAIPDPMNFAGGAATNLMGDDPDTEGTIEGFPDITTTATDRGYSGNSTPRDGYVLYMHDRISADNTTEFEIVSYINVLTTEYYYTCEADGTVRQFDGANVDTATEYVGTEEFKMETIVTVDIVIYTEPEG